MTRFRPTTPISAAALVTHLACTLGGWALACALALPSPARAADEPTRPEVAAGIRTAVEGWLEGRYKVEDVRRTPIPGIYEVRIGTDLIYVDEKAQHAFIEGSLVDIKSNRNLTRERTDELLTINWKDLPLNLAIKQVNGTGKRQLAVFEDPNCGYCKNMRRDLVGLKDATIYTFVIPILAPDSEVKARKALCAPDRQKAWNDLMLSNKVPENAGSCDSPLAKIRDLGQKLGISATPTVFFVNGKRLRGYVPPAEFERMLAENSKG
jgi:thiol:disulfide interchange protein DsbC